MNKLKSTLVVAVVCFAAGWFIKGENVQVVEVEKIVYQERTDKKSNIKKDVSKKEIIKPDGTKIIETTTSTSRNSEVSTDVSLDKNKSKTVTQKHNWRVSVMYGPALPGFQREEYTLDVQRRIWGDVFIGAYGSTQNNFGLSIGLQF